MVASRTVLVRIRADADQLHRELATSTTGMRRFGDEADRTDRSIDRLSGRVRLLGETVGALGPGMVPILGATAQATAGLATQMGFTVLAAGSAVIAFQGMGDALKALSDARLDPTTANLAKAEAAMERLSPAGQDLARTISGLSDEWKQTKAIAQGGLFPGVDQAIDSMMTRLPELQRILATVSTTAGDLLAEGADSLASDRWDGLFTYLETSAKPILTDTAHTAGDLTHALSELIIAMDPLTRDFTRGLAAAADDFDRWASGLSQTEGFAEFVDYMRTEGPHVAETVGDIASSLASVVEAGSGAGSASLDLLQVIATTVKTIADSPLGPVLIQLVQVVSVMALLNRAWTGFATGGVASFVQGQRQAVDSLTTTISAQQRATSSVDQLAAAQGKLAAQQRSALGALSRGAAGVAGMGLAALDAQHHVTGLGAASGALMGWAVSGGPWGAAIGGAIGLLTDLARQSQEAAARSDDFAATLDRQTGALTENSRAWVANQLGADYLRRLQEAGVDINAMTTALLEGGDAWDQFAGTATAAMGDVEAVDGNLAAMAESRGYEFGEAAQGAGLLGGKVAALAVTIRDGKADFQVYGDAVGDTGAAFRNAAADVDTFTSNLQELNAWLDKRAAFRDYKDSIAEANRVLGDSKSTHREIAAALDDVARKTGVVAEGMSKADRQKFLTEALADLRDLKGQGDVADGVIRRLLAQLRELNGTDVNTYINVITRRTSSGGSAQTPGFGPQEADGGTVPKTGRGYADRHPYLLADGEEIISNRYGQADRHRQLLKAINDNRLPEPAPAVFPYSAAAASSSIAPGSLSDATLRHELHLTRVELRELRRATTDIAPGRTGRAVMDRINEGAAQGMREAQW